MYIQALTQAFEAASQNWDLFTFPKQPEHAHTLRAGLTWTTQIVSMTQ